MTEDASDLSDQDNWIGGFYELAIEIGPRNRSRMERCLQSLWKHSSANGPFVHQASSSRYEAASCTFDAIDTYGRLH